MRPLSKWGAQGHLPNLKGTEEAVVCGQGIAGMGRSQLSAGRLSTSGAARGEEQLETL